MLFLEAAFQQSTLCFWAWVPVNLGFILPGGHEEDVSFAFARLCCAILKFTGLFRPPPAARCFWVWGALGPLPCTKLTLVWNCKTNEEKKLQKQYSTRGRKCVLRNHLDTSFPLWEALVGRGAPAVSHFSCLSVPHHVLLCLHHTGLCTPSLRPVFTHISPFVPSCPLVWLVSPGPAASLSSPSCPHQPIPSSGLFGGDPGPCPLLQAW